MTQAHASGTMAGLTNPPADLTGLFVRVGAELRTLAKTVNDLQHFLAPLVGDVVRSDPAALVQLQNLDHLEQSLHGLSDLMDCLDASATLTDAGALASGLGTLRLGALARRLSSAAPARSAPEDAAAFELF